MKNKLRRRELIMKGVTFAGGATIASLPVIDWFFKPGHEVPLEFDSQTSWVDDPVFESVRLFRDPAVVGNSALNVRITPEAARRWNAGQLYLENEWGEVLQDRRTEQGVYEDMHIHDVGKMNYLYCDRKDNDKTLALWTFRTPEKR